MEDLHFGRIRALVPEFAVKDPPLGRTLMMMTMMILYIYIVSVLPKGRSFTANSGTKTAILLKADFSTTKPFRKGPGGSSGKALIYGLDGPGSIPGVVGVEIFFTPSCPDWPWGPLNLL